jgi:hypothetical protein
MEGVSDLNGLVRPSSNEKKKKGAEVLPTEKDAGKHVSILTVAREV